MQRVHYPGAAVSVYVITDNLQEKSGQRSSFCAVFLIGYTVQCMIISLGKIAVKEVKLGWNYTLRDAIFKLTETRRPSFSFSTQEFACRIRW